jgi:hypothetical protein
MSRLVSKLSRDNLKSSTELSSSPEQHRRASSEATPRPSGAFSRPAAEFAAAEAIGRRLGFFTSNFDKSSSSAGGKSSANGSTPVPSNLLPPRSHSRADSSMSTLTGRDGSATASPSSSQMLRAQPSPSKVSVRSVHIVPNHAETPLDAVGFQRRRRSTSVIYGRSLRLLALAHLFHLTALNPILCPSD